MRRSIGHDHRHAFSGFNARVPEGLTIVDRRGVMKAGLAGIAGVVTMCEIVSSELSDEELERRLVQRIKMFRFEARDVESITTTKPIDFFPA